MGIKNTFIFDRMQKVLGSDKDKDLAANLDISPQAVSNARKKGEIPSDMILTFAEKNKLSVDWLLTGKGQMSSGGDLYELAEELKAADIGGELPEGFVQVPRYEVAASAGGGAMIYSEQIVDHLSFKAEWIHNALGVSVKDLALIHVTGDSMEPTLSEGDLILIDMSYRGMKDNAIYVLQLNGSLLVKRLQHKLDGSVLVKSDNAIYDSEMIPIGAIDSLNVVGRVVWCGRRM